MRGPEYIEALNRAAGALAQLATILYMNEHRELVPLAERDILAGRFEDGGNLLRSSSGQLYKALCVRRADALEALEVIRRTRQADHSAAGPAAEKPD